MSYPYGVQGMQYAAPQQYSTFSAAVQAAMKLPNPIGEEGYRLLKSKGGGKVNFYIPKEEILRMLCTHRHNGELKVHWVDPERAILHCDICDSLIDMGTVFDTATLNKIVGYLVTAWNQMKMKNTGVISNEIITDLGKAIALVERFPAAMEVVDQNFVKNSVAANNIQYGFVDSASQALNMLHGTGGYGYQPYYQQSSPVFQSQVSGNPFMGTMPPAPMPPMGPAPAPGYGYPPPPQPGYGYPPPPPPAYAASAYPQQPGYGYPPPPAGAYNAQPQYPQNSAPPAAAGTVVPEAYPPPSAPAPQPASAPEQSVPKKISKVFEK